MDKLIFKVKKFTAGESNVIRLTDKAMACIYEVQAGTGLSAREIASRMVEFAADKVEIEDEQK